MLIKVTYDKTTGVITYSNDIKNVAINISDESKHDTEDSLHFEIAVDTTAYEISNTEYFEEEE